MSRAARWTVAATAYAVFFALVGYLSASPAYRYGSAELATIKLSLSHATERVEPCVRLTPEEVAKLAPNMRRAEKCERARLPLIVELDIDGEAVRRIEALPSGVWGDGAASVYERLEFAPGRHRISVRLRDSSREQGWDYAHTEMVELAPGRYFTITFHPATGGFRFR